jgi:hypothetical protein
MVVQLAIRQLVAYNAWDLDGFANCYHPQVQVYQGSELQLEGRDALREAYRAKFEGGDFGGIVPRRIERDGACIEEEHFWTKSGVRGCILVEYTEGDGCIRTVRFTRFDPLVTTLETALLAGKKTRIPGLGMFTPCTARSSGCRTVMFRSDDQATDDEAVLAIRGWFEQQDTLELVGLGTFKLRKNRLLFHADEGFKERLTAAIF